MPSLHPSYRHLQFRQSFAVSGKPILRGVNLTIERGEHVAIVGPSGAGKSSLVGLLLGWHTVPDGMLLVDGEVLTAQSLHRLRSETAWVDPQMRLRVGPRSAGSEPGPACFGRGGNEPTVTDANLRLGRIGGGSFLGGRLSLNTQAANAAIGDRIAAPLGYGTHDAATTRVAHGILDLANTLMAGAVKEITVARGHDVREFTLLVFGGVALSLAQSSPDHSAFVE